MLEAEESSVKLYLTSTSPDRPSREIPAKLFAWRILSVTFLPFTHTMYILITYKSKVGYLERKPQIDFYNSTHPHFRERATHPLVRNHYSLFSFPLSLLYLKKRFVHTQTQPTPIQNVESVLKLGKLWGFAKRNR